MNDVICTVKNKESNVYAVDTKQLENPFTEGTDQQGMTISTVMNFQSSLKLFAPQIVSIQNTQESSRHVHTEVFKFVTQEKDKDVEYTKQLFGDNVNDCDHTIID